MMFLHKDRELFREAVFAASTELSLPVAVIEKDYYVTMLLHLLAQKAPDCVFKGGTSLSKCFQAIDRFSEDIDIAFSNRLSGAQRRDLKNTAIAGISAELDLPIAIGRMRAAVAITTVTRLPISRFRALSPKVLSRA